MKLDETLLLLCHLSQIFKPLLGLTRSRGKFWAAIRMFHCPEPSGRVVHGEIDGLVIGRQHSRRFVLLHHTHRLQRRPYPICSSRKWSVRHWCGGGLAGPTLFLGGSSREWVLVSGMKVRSLVRLSNHFVFHWWSTQSAALLLFLSDEPKSCCAAGTNERLDLRGCAYAPGGQVSAEWSRCLGSMARRASESVARLRRSSAGWMPARTGNLFPGMGRRHSVTISKASWWQGQWGGYEHCGTIQDRSTLQLNGPGYGHL